MNRLQGPGDNWDDIGVWAWLYNLVFGRNGESKVLPASAKTDTPATMDEMRSSTADDERRNEVPMCNLENVFERTPLPPISPSKKSKYPSPEDTATKVVQPNEKNQDDEGDELQLRLEQAAKATAERLQNRRPLSGYEL